MDVLHEQFEEFVDGVTCQSQGTASSFDRIDEVGTALWELLVCPENRQALAHKQPLSAIISDIRSVVQNFTAVCTPSKSKHYFRARL